MSGTTVKRQPVNPPKRKCTRADPAQARVLLKNYDAEARPSTEQFAVMSQETNLCVILIPFVPFPDTAVARFLRCSVCPFPMPVWSPCSPVDWIKKWFLRKRKADGTNRTLPPTEPTLVENEPSPHDGQVLGHTHSKFWDMDGFAAADSTNFSPSVGYIPKLYGHRKSCLPPANANNRDTGFRENEEGSAILPLGTSATETDYGYVVPFDSVIKTVETATLPNYSLREVLLGTDAFVGYVPPSADRNALAELSEHPNVTPTVDDPGSTLPLSSDSSPGCATYSDDPYEGCTGSATELEFTLANHPITIPFPEAIDDFAALGGYDPISTTSHSTSDNLKPGGLDSAAGCLDLDLGSFPGFANVPDYMTSILSEHSSLYEDLLLLQAKEDPIGDSTGLDFFLGTGADHFVFALTGFEFCE